VAVAVAVAAMKKVLAVVIEIEKQRALLPALCYGLPC
jgi:hypothetical protein